MNPARTGTKAALHTAVEIPAHGTHEIRLRLSRAASPDLGRDPREITVSTHLRLQPGMDPKELAELASTFAEHGADLGVVQLPVPYRPAILEPLAEALAEVNR